MMNNSFVITLTGPSQSGKSLVMKKILQLGEELRKQGISFYPQKIKKYTTRYLRLDELELLEQGEDIDIEHVQQIPSKCDMVYQTYGVRYGMETKVLLRELENGYSPIVVLNDIRAVEEIRKYFSGKVLSLFLFRKIPEIQDFKVESQIRGNVSEQEVVARYEKAIAIYRTYIENIVLYDNVILNSVEYDDGKELCRDTIMDLQLKNVMLPIIQGEKKLRIKIDFPKSSRIFVVAGNAASGKDEIVRALISMGMLQVKVLPKFTMRQKEPEDGEEMICQYIPKQDYLNELRKNYLNQKDKIAENLNKMDKEFFYRYKKEFISFKQQLEEKNQNEYERFWGIISEKIINNKESQETILQQFFEENFFYEDLLEIKEKSKKIYEDNGVGVYEKGKKRYLIYGSNNILYGCDITEMQKNLDESKYHMVVVASQIGVVNALKELYGNQKVKLVYAHSEISAREFEANASDITKKEKKDEFRRILNAYTEEISNYDHVTIYAKSQLTYEQTSKEEELVDQMFRLLRAYK